MDDPPQEDVAIVTSEAGAVEEFALCGHSLHHVDLIKRIVREKEKIRAD